MLQVMQRDEAMRRFALEPQQCFSFQCGEQPASITFLQSICMKPERQHSRLWYCLVCREDRQFMIVL
ncbi:MAG: hypothetical protein C5S41_01240, partial [Candidatus Methanomarinus sp.]